MKLVARNLKISADTGYSENNAATTTDTELQLQQHKNNTQCEKEEDGNKRMCRQQHK